MSLKIVSLDTMIRERAKTEAQARFNRMMGDILKHGHSGTWNDKFKYEDFKDLKDLLEKFMHGIYIPKEEQQAVNAFFATYQRLQVEFPDFGQEG